MQLKNIFHYFFFLIALSACESKSQINKNSQISKAGQPNIIYIIADDLGYNDLSCYGQKNFSTPNIDRLASQGMLFTQHYSGSTVCAPSRSVLMTGLHTGHTFIRGNREVKPEGQHPLSAEIYTMAEALQDEGYETGAFGKWGLGFPDSEGDPMKQGFDRFYGINCQRYGHHYYPHHLWDNDQKVILEKNEGKNKGSYAPTLIQAEVINFIEANKDRPFFLFKPTIIPHAELSAPESYMKKNRGKFLPEKEYEGYDEGTDYRKGPYESQTETHAAFVSMIQILDDHVGEIMDKVEELGIADNTLIIFTSDNGPHIEGGADPEYFDSNGPLKGFKRDLYEGGIRVPMIAKWPSKIKAGSKTDHISAFWDVYPTLGEIAGFDSKEEMDGISFVPTLMSSGDQMDHEYLYWEFHEKGGRQAARKGNWKGVKYEVLKNPDRLIELYDLSKDIGEENNIAEAHSDIVAEMTKIFEIARTDSDVFPFNPKTINLFNGQNTNGWHIDIPDMDTVPNARNPFIVRDGKLVSLGTPQGHLITNNQYENYRLEVKYRFAGEPGNCGVLVHASTPRSLYKMFPKSIEVQMYHENAGDFWCIVEDIKVPDMEARRGPPSEWGITEGKKRRILNLTDGTENELGEWNKMKIECLGDKLKVWLNGELVNYGYESTAQSGQIAVQAEGAEVEFEHIRLTPITKLSD